MAGHSKWANIRHKKARADAQRGRIFTKLAKEIIVAAKQGGPDPDVNFKLRMAIQKARSQNMPADNIERAIRRATGEEADTNYEELVYEGYGPAGVAILLEISTDNRNRTAAEIRHIFSRRGGSLGESGCVAWMFDQKGRIVVDLEKAGLDEDSLMLRAIESGAEDMEVDDGVATILCSPSELESVQNALSADGVVVDSAEVVRIPKTTVEVDGDNAPKVLQLIEDLEDNDDVSAVYANFEIADEVLEQLTS
ncbi:MAG: YebC/PmpR family DNA-binding transcriptional regulator [Bacillota bacterium]|jgi:YebC/PmpR family DNA-binding regulatory protein|nr:YebC/PmpR family DNA-binding transcriptional regulator [Bacillota bacterium]HOB91733.1 YebC/PmpR family DNA-binding transcriptional regulator [Bacillota bacterium]HPZ54602.1 YebC/PmpR family DNA-binding transcriptional regulator [Bacillota bacterium]HQD19030.1 YebC/PmpR family DNA-binding transcriptional regulator [Bacillota bacterium]